MLCGEAYVSLITKKKLKVKLHVYTMYSTCTNSFYKQVYWTPPLPWQPSICWCERTRSVERGRDREREHTCTCINVTKWW